jgi:hypothetical protein
LRLSFSVRVQLASSTEKCSAAVLISLVRIRFHDTKILSTRIMKLDDPRAREAANKALKTTGGRPKKGGEL